MSHGDDESKRGRTDFLNRYLEDDEDSEAEDILEGEESVNNRREFSRNYKKSASYAWAVASMTSATAALKELAYDLPNELEANPYSDAFPAAVDEVTAGAVFGLLAIYTAKKAVNVRME